MRSTYNATLGAEIARLNDLGLAELRRVWKERLGVPVPAEYLIQAGRPARRRDFTAKRGAPTWTPISP